MLTEWGYERTVARTQGLKVLFAGESGTGKTMAAAGARRASSASTSTASTSPRSCRKYIGETEKNLERIFAAADGSNAILFFDEADALFGKRSEVSRRPRPLRQHRGRLPAAADGGATRARSILATNLRANIDDAFVRRLRLRRRLPVPRGRRPRADLASCCCPTRRRSPTTSTSTSSPTQFKLSGGAIRNCSLAAAFQAADDDSAIAMRHLVRAVAQEYGKQGRLTLEADFDRFHDLVRARGTARRDAAVSRAMTASTGRRRHAGRVRRAPA